MLLSSLLLKPSLQPSICQLMFHIQIYWHQALVTKTLVSNPPMVRLKFTDELKPMVGAGSNKLPLLVRQIWEFGDLQL